MVYEFDFFDDLCAFDTDFIENVDSQILDNICSTLSCARGDITHVEPLKAGLTNLSVLFDCKGERYVYRHPGAGTEEIVNRDAETIALKTAAELGLDTSFIFEDPAAGWKISRFIPDCVDFDYRNEAHVSGALAIARRLHESGATSPYSFDFYDEACKIVGLLKAEGWRMPEGFDETAATIAGLVAPMREGSGDPVLCHNDFYGPNLLVHDGDICLIDWEYAAMGDYGCDIGNAFGFLSLVPREGGEAQPVFAPSETLNANEGMPTAAYITPPDGTPIRRYWMKFSPKASLWDFMFPSIVPAPPTCIHSEVFSAI